MKDTINEVICNPFTGRKFYQLFRGASNVFAITFALALLLVIGTYASAQSEPTKTDAPIDESSFLVRAYTVTYADVQRIEPHLQPLLSKNGSISIDRRTNSIIVKDMESHVRSIKETINQLDREMPVHTFHLNYANADKIAKK